VTAAGTVSAIGDSSCSTSRAIRAERRSCSFSPLSIRDRVRDWLSPLVDGVSLDEPVDWSDWDPQRRQ
jgi:hypothetical protein